MTARDSNALSTLGITHVVSALEHAPVLPDSISAQRRLHVCIADRSDVDILRHFEETTAFIRKALAEDDNHRVLVCMSVHRERELWLWNDGS
jgi:atypical dual specificity phosphatase